MLLSIKEQIALLVAAAVVLFSLKGSAHVTAIENAELLLNVVSIGVFAYSLLVLYDTAKSVLIIIDLDDYQFMQNRLAILEGIARGERAISEGKALSHDEAKDKISKWLK